VSDVVILRRESVVTIVRGGISSPVIQQIPAANLIIQREGIPGLEPGPPGPEGVVISTIGITLDAGVTTIGPGVKLDIPVEHAQKITGWTLLGNRDGNLEVDVLMTSYAAFPAGFVSIVGSTPPELIAQEKAEGDAADWIVDIPDDSILRYTVVGADLISRATLTLNVEKG
jgi:hypothetical protein